MLSLSMQFPNVYALSQFYLRFLNEVGEVCNKYEYAKTRAAMKRQECRKLCYEHIRQ